MHNDRNKNLLGRLIVLIACLLLASMLTGCLNKDSDTGKDSDKQPVALVAKTPEKEVASPQYYFLNGSLLGCYSKEGWHSLCAPDTNDRTIESGDAFWAKDLLAQDAYYVYDSKNKKLLSVSKQIIWSTGTGGLGNFEDDQAGKKLAAYGQLYNPIEGDTSLPRIFSLPVKTGQDLEGLKIPDYSFFTQFIISSKTRIENELVTNRISDLFPRETTGGLEATDAGEQTLADLLKKKKIENAPPNFFDCIKCDFDQDGKLEFLMFANNPRSENGYPLLGSSGGTEHLGIYSAMFYQDDDGSVQILYSDLRPYQDEFKLGQNNFMELMNPDYCIFIDLMTIADLNNDGVYEILVRKSGWENGYYLTYALNAEGNYEPVMRSNFGT
jgi:hypothetical protein